MVTATEILDRLEWTRPQKTIEGCVNRGRHIGFLSSLSRIPVVLSVTYI